MFIVTKLDHWKVNKNYELCCNGSKLHGRELNLYSSPDIWVMKSGRVRWVVHISHIGREEPFLHCFSGQN